MNKTKKNQNRWWRENFSWNGPSAAAAAKKGGRLVAAPFRSGVNYKRAAAVYKYNAYAIKPDLIPIDISNI